MIRKNGFTIIELLLVTGLLMSMTSITMDWFEESELKAESNSFSSEISNLIFAIDRRLYIDGTYVNLWNQTEWSTSSQVTYDLIDKQLIAKGNVCGASNGWNPVLPHLSHVSLVPCNMWHKKIPFNLNVESSIVQNDGFIEKFYITYSFKNKEDMENNFKYVYSSLTNAKSYPSTTINGTVNFHLAHSDNLDHDIEMVQCMQDFTDCYFVSSLILKSN